MGSIVGVDRGAAEFAARLDALYGHDENGTILVPVSVREVGRAVDRSPGTVQRHLRVLTDAGMIRRGDTPHRPSRAHTPPPAPTGDTWAQVCLLAAQDGQWELVDRILDTVTQPRDQSRGATQTARPVAQPSPARDTPRDPQPPRAEKEPLSPLTPSRDTTARHVAHLETLWRTHRGTPLTITGPAVAELDALPPGEASTVVTQLARDIVDATNQMRHPGAVLCAVIRRRDPRYFTTAPTAPSQPAGDTTRDWWRNYTALIGDEETAVEAWRARCGPDTPTAARTHPADDAWAGLLDIYPHATKPDPQPRQPNVRGVKSGGSTVAC